MNRTEIIAASTIVTCALLWAVAMVKIDESNDLQMRAMCRADMIAAEVSKLDRGIAVDLHKFTNGRSAEEMRDLPQCKDAL